MNIAVEIRAVPQRGHGARASATQWSIISMVATVVMAHGSVAATAKQAGSPNRANLCGLLSNAEVSRALGVQIVRSEALTSAEPGCEFSAQGSPASLTVAHNLELAKSTAAAHGAPIDGPTEKLLETFGNTVLQGSDADTSAAASARHPGEVPVFSFAIQRGNAAQQMSLARRTQAGLAPKGVKTVTGLGDEAFDSGGAMLTVRKGNTMVQFTYPSCACTTSEIVPLARKVVGAL